MSKQDEYNGRNGNGYQPISVENSESARPPVSDSVAGKCPIARLVMWQIPEIAPRTGEMILADMGWPWPCLVCWNKSQEEWVYVTQQMNLFDGQEEPYFENEYGKAAELKCWMPLPELAT